MTQKWNDLKKKIWREDKNGAPKCGYCEAADARDLAHALIHKRAFNNSKRHKDIDVEENALPNCVPCQPFSESYAGRCHAYKKITEKIGAERVDLWYDSVTVIKENFQ